MKPGKRRIVLLDTTPKKAPLPAVPLKPILRRATRITLASPTESRRRKLPTGEILVVFCGDKEIRKVKKTFWGKAMTTDVVSLDHGARRPRGAPAVEIIINTQQAMRQKRWGYREELIFLYIHGLLHVLGWKDDTALKRRRMLAAGEKILRQTLDKSRFE